MHSLGSMAHKQGFAWRSAQPPTPRKPPRPQAAWPEHKKCHKAAAGAGDGWAYCTKRGRGRSALMPPFHWTGDLRPYKIGPPRQVRAEY